MSANALQVAPFARVLDVSIDEYHNDPCATPSLSSSIAHILTKQSPLHAWSAHPRFGNVRPPPTEELDDGAIIHMILLGKGPKLQIIQADNFRTKLAQEMRDNARAAGHIPLIERRYQEIMNASVRLRENMVAEGIELHGESEVAIEWQGDDGVLCRCRLDHLDGARIYDLKKIRSADERTCDRHADAYGYDIQREVYVEALEHLHRELEGRVDFQFVFMELDAPFCVVPRPASSSLIALGESKWRRAKATWKRCLAENRWPGYRSTPLNATPWAINDEESQL